MYYTVEDGKENCIEISGDKNTAITLCKDNVLAKEVFEFDDNHELVGCIYRK